MAQQLAPLGERGSPVYDSLKIRGEKGKIKGVEKKIGRTLEKRIKAGGYRMGPPEPLRYD